MSEIYEETSQADMQGLLDRQRDAYLAEGVVSAATRIDRLERAIQAVKKHQKAFVEAMNDDLAIAANTSRCLPTSRPPSGRCAMPSNTQALDEERQA